MKRYKKLFLTAGVGVALAASLGACTGDLDLTPTDPSTITPGTFKDNPTEYMEQVISDVYMQIATYGANGNNPLTSMDGGMSTFQRACFGLEEIPTDEASWLPVGDAIDHQFQYGTSGQVPDNDVLMGAYSRMFVIISMANQFMQTDFGCTTEAEQRLFEEFSRQARILRDGVYWYAIDCFGNVPWQDESVQMGSVAPQLSQNFAEGRRMVFDAVTADLEEIVAYYKANDPNNKPPYGYVGLDAAEAMLVKYYLNAEVYTGTARWKDCYDHAAAIISRLGRGGFENSGLCKGYHQNFGYNNSRYAIGGADAVNEIIWTIPQQQPALNDGVGLLSYANSTFMCNAWIGTSTDKDPFSIDIADYNSGNGWKCMATRRQFVDAFTWNADYTYSPDLRTQFWRTAAHGFSVENPEMDQANWGRNGFLAVKYTNWWIDDNNQVDRALSPTATDQLGADYAMIRLAEIYLSAAEAAAKGGGPADKALEYTNLIRRRAALSPVPSVSVDAVRDERTRELYTENTRRSDLIRYGKWLSGYTWNWKNGVEQGANFPSNFIVYPLPSLVCNRNGYTQNPGF